MNTDEKILEVFIESHSLEATQIIEDLNDGEVAALIQELPVELATRVMNLMNKNKAARCIEAVDKKLAAELIERMDITSAELLLRQLDDQLRDSLLKKIPKKTASVISQKLTYPENSVGALMNPLVITFRENVTVNEAITKIKEQKLHISMYAYIVKSNNKLAGIIKLEDLLVADKDDKISSIMKKDVPILFADTLIEAVLLHPGWLEYYALPVVDRAEILVGTVKLETIRQITINSDQKNKKQAMQAGSALGELFRIGLTGLVRSAGK